MWRAGERGGLGEVKRGELGRFRGLLTPGNRFLPPSELGLASGLVGGLGLLLGDPPNECASIGLTRRPPEVGEARSDTSSTCRCEGSSGCGFGESSTRPFPAFGDRDPAMGDRGDAAADELAEMARGDDAALLLPDPLGGVMLMNVGATRTADADACGTSSMPPPLLCASACSA